MDWIREHAFQIITAIVAFYGAVLSTITVVMTRRDKKRRLHTSIRYGLLTYGPTLSPPHLLLVAANPGHVSVTIRSAAVWLSNGKTAPILPGQSEISMPHEFLPGQSATCWVEVHPLAQALHDKGVSGGVKLRAQFSDATGKEYLSKAIRFNVDEWLEKVVGQ